MQSMDWNNGFARKAGKYFIVIPHEVNEIGGNILNTITVEELAQNGTEGLQLIDVRPENDFSHGAIESAVNLPLEKIEAGETAILKKDQPVYLYCHVGENSRDAAEILEDDGFTTVNLEGGYRAWLRYQLTRVTMEDDSIKERTEQIEKSLIKKFRKPIWSRFTKALHDYEMIKDGDKIAVCISGGKDSMLLAKLFQELYRHGKRNFGLVFLCMNPGYNEENWRIIQENAKLLDIPLTTFETQIFDSVAEVDKNPCYLCARMRRGYLYSKAKELGCNKIALGHHFDDVIETILMGILYGGQINTMMPKLHSTNFQGMELIRPLYYVKEEDILNWKDYNSLHFLQCACRFTERIAKEQAARGMAGEAADIVHTSKRQEMKELIRSLRKTSPFIDANIMKSVENINLDACLGYVKDGVRRHFMDEYDER